MRWMAEELSMPLLIVHQTKISSIVCPKIIIQWASQHFLIVRDVVKKKSCGAREIAWRDRKKKKRYF